MKIKELKRMLKEAEARGLSEVLLLEEFKQRRTIEFTVCYPPDGKTLILEPGVFECGIY